MEKYRIKEDEAIAMADFLVPMLEWYPEKRATAQEMLSHPWFDMKPNYEYKYTDREYEVMMLKKQLKDQVKGAPAKGLDDSVQEMNELIESDQEANAADIDDLFSEDDYGDDEDDLSLWDSDEERVRKNKRKEKDAKINNSFTGPYPLDPTDFNHTDKGPNAQFEHMEANHHHQPK